MGWKSTEIITRDEAIKLIEARLYEASNYEISTALEALGYGDEESLKYFGHNFIVVDKIEQED